MSNFNFIYAEAQLTHRAKTVYIYLRDRADASGVCWPGIKTIAGELGLSTRTVQRALDDGCDKIVAILSKPRGFIKKPEGMRFLYSRMCRKFPNTVKALDNRHIMYGKCQQQLYNLEKEGKAFIFAPSNPPKMSTYTMDREVEQQLYDLGMKDFHDAEDRFKKFLI